MKDCLENDFILILIYVITDQISNVLNNLSKQRNLLEIVIVIG